MNYRPYVSDSQTKGVDIIRDIARAMENAWSSEQSNWTNGSTETDPFYTLPTKKFQMIQVHF